MGSFSATWQIFRFYYFQNVTSPTVFIGSHPNFMRTLLTMGECSLLLFLAIGQVLPNLWHFEILTLESMGKPKCGVSRTRLTVEGKGQQFGTRGTTGHIWRLLLMPDSLSLVWSHIQCTLQNFQFYKF